MCIVTVNIDNIIERVRSATDILKYESRTFGLTAATIRDKADEEFLDWLKNINFTQNPPQKVDCSH